MFIDSLGAIKGTPTQIKPLTNYVIIGENAFGSDTASVSFEVVGCSITGFNPFPDTINSVEESVTLNVGLGFKNYLWNSGDTISQIKIRENGFYTIKVTDENTCIAYDSILVRFSPKVSVVTPIIGNPGTLVTVSGSNLTGISNMFLGDIPIIYISSSDSSIVGMIMPESKSGLISFETSFGNTSVR
jgi:hypothetical protein